MSQTFHLSYLSIISCFTRPKNQTDMSHKPSIITATQLWKTGISGPPLLFILKGTHSHYTVRLLCTIICSFLPTFCTLAPVFSHGYVVLDEVLSPLSASHFSIVVNFLVNFLAFAWMGGWLVQAHHSSDWLATFVYILVVLLT